jgi:hypothetical protein
MNNFEMGGLAQELPPAPGRPDPLDPPDLMEQIVGVFTGPVPLFKRLAAAPRWGASLAAFLGLGLAMNLIWARKVDAGLLLRPILERDPATTPATLAKVIEIQGRLLGWFAVLGMAGQLLAILALAGLYLLVVRTAAMPEAGRRPGCRHALSAVTVPLLLQLPKFILVSCLCLVRPVLGLFPDQLSPFSLGFFVHPASNRAAALVTGLDLFVLAGLALTWLAARHLLGLDRPRAAACTLLAAALTLVRVLAAAG